MDTWLHRTRLFKTRGLAARQIALGRVRLTRGPTTTRVTKPHFQLRPGDHLTLLRERELICLEVLGIPHRRGPAPEAQGCYARTEDA